MLPKSRPRCTRSRPPSAWLGLAAFLSGQREGPSIRLGSEAEKGLSLDEITHLELDTRLGWRHPLVEIGLAGLFIFTYLQAPSLERGIVWAAFLAILLLITVIDLEHRLVLFVTIIPSVIIALVLNALFPDITPQGENRPISDYLLGGLLGGGVFFLMFLGGGVFSDVVSAMRGRQLGEVAFGFGDVMLAILCGFMIGWRAMIFAMFITVFAGAAGAILYMGSRLLRRRRYMLYTPLPYGPYIVLGTVIMLLFLEEFRSLF
ncbi:MAG: prepilin peptidase [Anaerolineae bacterium]|nr:prepilin peptidase [Anaerolineae bacterium]